MNPQLIAEEFAEREADKVYPNGTLLRDSRKWLKSQLIHAFISGFKSAALATILDVDDIRRKTERFHELSCVGLTKGLELSPECLDEWEELTQTLAVDAGRLIRKIDELKNDVDAT